MLWCRLRCSGDGEHDKHVNYKADGRFIRKIRIINNKIIPTNLATDFTYFCVVSTYYLLATFIVQCAQ